MARMYNKTYRTFEKVADKRSTLALAKVWNNKTQKIEDWAALRSQSPMSDEVADALSGHTIVPDVGHAEESICSHLESLNDAGGDYEMMGITSSGRFCTTRNCYGALLFRGMEMLDAIGKIFAEEGYSEFRAAVNRKRYSR